MKKPLIVWIVLLISSCTTINSPLPTPTISITATSSPSATPPPSVTPTPEATIFPATRPDDFQAEYYWEVGSLPEPYFYYYVITIGPDTEGHILFSPDYPSNDPPQWQETFSVDEYQLDSLYTQLRESGALTGNWQESLDPPTGGVSDGLEIRAYGQNISIPSYMDDEQHRRDSNAIEEYVTTLVPDTIWEELNTLHENYIEEHDEG